MEEGDLATDRAKDIVVVGGGASGIAAAVRAAQLAPAPVRVQLLEGSKRIGHPILVSGNGRCNFSNSQLGPSDYHGAGFVGRAFEANPPQMVWDWFSDLGLASAEEGEGRLYPMSNKASSVLDVLRLALDEAGVRVTCACPISRIRPSGAGWKLEGPQGRTISAAAVVVSTGSAIAPGLLPEGHRLEPSSARLCALRTRTDALRGLDGVRVKGRAMLLRAGDEGGDGAPAGPAPGSAPSLAEVASERGELQFRPFGVSGIAIFNLSRFAQAGDVLALDLLPEIPGKKLSAELHARVERHPARTAEQLLAGLVLPSVARACLRAAGLEAGEPLGAHGRGRDLARLVDALKRFSVPIVGFEEKNAQVHRGGVALDAVDPLTMESHHAPGLYITGEALDVDGPCGGYNLHWAWTSGLLAGAAAAARAARG